ncbi:MAG TPA: hypothetical protein VEP91_06185 [Solirubrobacterales bacterium]|nr:hypothetical protein [Solirubrobacterales bacterium]
MSDACPSCGSSLLPDQRYCLSCGQRRGEPRLPIMDAVTYMDASKRPRPAATAAPPTPPSRRRPSISASSSLVAVVATLVLALGVGVMIGRSGDGGASNAAAPQIIRVGGGEASTATASTAGGAGAAAGKGGKKANSATVKKAKEKAATGASGASKATEEVFEPAPGVKIAPPEQQLGGECDPSVAGCGSNGKFEGNFFE